MTGFYMECNTGLKWVKVAVGAKDLQVDRNKTADL